MSENPEMGHPALLLVSRKMKGNPGQGFGHGHPALSARQ